MSDSDDSGLKAELEKIKQSLQGGDDEPDMVEAQGRQPSQGSEKPDMIEAAGRQPEEEESSEAETNEAQGRQPEPPGSEGEHETLEAKGRQPTTEESTGETASSSTPGDRINEGNTYVVEITDIASKGDGMLSYRGKTIIVPETEIDEVVKIRITTNSRNFAFGEVVERDVDGEPINSKG
ncbi:MAG: TRAM domain-containing protein [Candidatus Nanohaloarchaea archaeon]|nr:TRAM domain-containing protein [Candidatus Nanohaloarchaea archaeon]